ncbi:MAG TPA: PHP domain-containing protein [bacterium]|uniref:PHP domain protein n=1 Tax=candidate division TA06 bacterium ADurb.Bin417 TaxID=1852828 RepID=A0A1V5MIT2_UNCT6|nr:MAG: PHP domain protein [candidate division TA06 bacterium ADurb.Bin417]HNS49181.1 PHP domain-containing protein [bacterium]
MTKETRSLGQRLISLEEGQTFLRRGWHASDLHVHTFFSHDVLPSRSLDPLTLYEKARRQGFRYITFTDHDTMAAYDRIGWTREGLVPGVEITIRDRKRVGHTLHINVYQLNRDQFQDLDAIRREANLEKLVAYLKSADLPFIYNHPFWFETRERPSYAVIQDVIHLFPVVEYNMHRVKQKNRLTLKLARKYGKGLVAATDTHIGDLGRAQTFAPGETFREFYDNIRAGNACLLAQDLTLDSLKKEMNAWIELIFKLDITTIEKTKYTGIKPIDCFINTFTRSRLKKSTPINRTARVVARSISKTGAPAIFYLKKQNLTARHIDRQLDLDPDLDLELG